MKKAQGALAVVKNRRPALWTFWPVECAYLREWNLQVRVWGNHINNLFNYE